MNRHLLILLDKTVFRILFYLTVFVTRIKGDKKFSVNCPLSGSENIMVIRPGGLGDGIMSVPFLKALRQRCPEGKITLVCVKKNKAALELLSCFDRLLVLDDTRQMLKNIIFVLRNKFDIVLDLEPFRKISSVVAVLSGGKMRVGFDTNDRRLLYTHYVTYANDKHFDAMNMIKQLGVFNIEIPEKEAVDMTFSLPDTITVRSENVLKEHDVDLENDFLVTVVPGVLKQHHRWEMDKFGALINMINSNDAGVKVLLLGTSADIHDAGKVMQHITENGRVINLVGKTSFEESLGILTKCRIMISCDGGIVYMASAMGCDTISIWGPGVMERFKPPGDHNVGIRKEYFCVPCINYSRLGEFPGCRYDRRCIKDISPEEVFKGYLKLKSFKTGE